MTAPLTAERLKHLRTAAEIGMRMASLQPHTVHVVPEELAALIDERLQFEADVVQLKAELQEALHENLAIRRSHERKAAKPELDDLIACFLALSADDRRKYVMSTMTGGLLAAREDKKLAPAIAELLGLQGIVILVADRVGPHLESTAHDDAPPICKMMIERVYEASSAIVADLCEPESTAPPVLHRGIGVPTKCKDASCGMEIEFAQTATGKVAPFHKDDRGLYVFENGVARLRGGGPTSKQLSFGEQPAQRYTSHFAVCPGAKRFRGRAGGEE